MKLFYLTLTIVLIGLSLWLCSMMFLTINLTSTALYPVISGVILLVLPSIRLAWILFKKAGIIPLKTNLATEQQNINQLMVGDSAR